MSAIRDYLFPINPYTARRELHLLPDSLEKFVGASSYASRIAKSGGEIKANDENDNYRKYVELVHSVGGRLAQQAKRKDIEFEFTVVKSGKETVWSLPGGKIGISVGFIEHMESEGGLGSGEFHNLEAKITAVLSHQIVHADARHTTRSVELRLLVIRIIKAAQLFFVHIFVDRTYSPLIAKATQDQDVPRIIAERDAKAKSVGMPFERAASWLIEGISSCHSRSHELESDRFGLRLVDDYYKKVSNYNPHVLLKVGIWIQRFYQKHHSHGTQTNFLQPVMNLFFSHSSPEERIEAYEQNLSDIAEGKL